MAHVIGGSCMSTHAGCSIHQDQCWQDFASGKEELSEKASSHKA